MAGGTVTLTLKTPDGTALAGCPVIVAPLTPTGAAAYATGDGHEIRRAHLSADGSGALSLSLEQTPGISPAGTVYQVTVCPPSGEWPVYTIVVPGVGPYRVMDVIIRPDTGGGGLSTQVVIFTNAGGPLLGPQPAAGSLPMVLANEQWVSATGAHGTTTDIPSFSPAVSDGAHFYHWDSPIGLGYNGANPFALGAFSPYLYNGSTVDIQRTPTTRKTAQALAAGNTALWTPTTGKKFRLMGLLVQITGNATVAAAGGGVLTVGLQDATTALSIALDFWLPDHPANVLGGVQSGWIDLGSGRLSALANNVLNINLSAALVTGVVRVIGIGTEE